METPDRFSGSPLHNKEEILNMMDKMDVKEMSLLVNLMVQLSNIKEAPIDADLYCMNCFSKVSKNHFERRHNHDHEHCSACGNDFFGTKTYSLPQSKEIVDSIRLILSFKNK